MVQQLRRQFLLRAHDTNLWAGYLPQRPGWFYPLALLGIVLVIIAFALVSGEQWVIRVLLLAGAVLIGWVLTAVSRFVRRRWQRRSVVRQQILDAIPWRGDEAVLDVGCGSGMLLNGAAARLTSGKALGIDIWAKHGGGGSLDLLYKQARVENVADRINFQEADARNMPFEDATFDVVLSSWALHHISRSSQDFGDAVSEMMRVLKPGGRIVVLDIAHMIEVLAMRLEKAGFAVEIQEAPFSQMIVIGQKG
ncbi:MAG: class I SAM-dependent methyltransferase [Ardenticatenaceae bacterium]|nr:class I SAM-dependent methyltransferase [Anaerolineales bacterium]MCB9008753.1 class I SAM-dependent methyltransferase [Ardenticatenaceae bacterium]